MANEEPLNVVGLRVSAGADVSDDAGRRVSPSGSGAFDGAPVDEADSLHEYLDVVRRHKLVVVLCALLTPLIAFFYSLGQEPRYEASSAVLVSVGGAGTILSEIPGITGATDPERLAATNISLARLPVVARRTVVAAGLSESALAFLGRSSVSADTDTEILRFSVLDSDPDRAKALATAYAQQFTRYRNGLDLDALRATRATISQTMAKLAAQGQGNSALHAELARAVRRLDATEAVRGSAAVLVQPAASAVQVGPRAKRNIAFGLVLGLLYGIGLAFLIERLDTRVRTTEHVEAIMGLPALGELPAPPNLPKSRRRVAMLEVPHGAYAESVRKLRANLEFASIDGGFRVLMVTSPNPGDGKTTLAADLAVALARSGRKVALCDLDARAPSLGRSFDLEGRRGLVDIVLGAESLDRALLSIPLATRSGARPPVIIAVADERDTIDDLVVSQSRGRTGDLGQLHFLPFGSRLPHDPGDFVNSNSVRHVVAQLRDAHDVVVIDTAPLLPVSDARVVSEYADAALIVCGLGKSSKPDLRNVRRIMSVLPTRVLGVAVTGVPSGPGYGAYEAHDARELAPDHGRA